MSYITVQYLKDNSPQLDLSRYNDTTISGVISRASAQVDNFTSRNFEFQSITSEKSETVIDEEGNLAVYVRNAPVDSVSDISISMGTYDITLTLTSDGENVFEIPEPKDRVIYPNDLIMTSTSPHVINLAQLRLYRSYTTIDYQGGYLDIPEDIKNATLLYTVDNIVRQQNLSGAQSITQGRVTVSYANNTGGRSDFVLDAETILSKYKRIV